MIRETFQAIIEGNEIRQNLISLKEELREDRKSDTHNREAALYYLNGDYTIFHTLLANEDPKVRKNTAIILGELAVPEFMDMLYEAYEKEQTMFVKTAYLKALEEFDCRKYVDAFKARMKKLSEIEVTEENKKHIGEEMRALSNLVLMMEGNKAHKFTGYTIPSEIVLVTNRNHIHVTTGQLENMPKKEFTAGVMAKTKNLEDVLNIRTFSELLFAIDGMKVLPNDVNKAAAMVADGKFLNFLEKRHEGGAPFYFRLEVKSKMDLSRRSTFAKRLGNEIERLSKRTLINSVNNYEVELRLIENKDGNFNVLVKLYTLKDDRFAYRKESIATSIQPVNAALAMELARPYIKENSQVLDPFCGVGTMLMERNRIEKGKTMYGLDIFGEAITKARANADSVHAVINYINRDFFDFTHEYLFDEIVTNMPFKSGVREEKELFEIYQKFFLKAKKHLKEDGIIIMYSHNRDHVKKLCTKPYKIEKEFEISMREGTYLFIIRYMG